MPSPTRSQIRPLPDDVWSPPAVVVGGGVADVSELFDAVVTAVADMSELADDMVVCRGWHTQSCPGRTTLGRKLALPGGRIVGHCKVISVERRLGE